MASDIEGLGEEVHGDLNQRLDALDGSMLVKAVVLAEIITADGERQIIMTHSRDAKVWETLGMIEYARSVELAGILDDRGET